MQNFWTFGEKFSSGLLKLHSIHFDETISLKLSKLLDVFFGLRVNFSGLLSNNFWQSCQNCFLRVQTRILGVLKLFCKCEQFCAYIVFSVNAIGRHRVKENHRLRRRLCSLNLKWELSNFSRWNCLWKIKIGMKKHWLGTKTKRAERCGYFEKITSMSVQTLWYNLDFIHRLGCSVWAPSGCLAFLDCFMWCMQCKL